MRFRIASRWLADSPASPPVPLSIRTLIRRRSWSSQYPQPCLSRPLRSSSTRRGLILRSVLITQYLRRFPKPVTPSKFVPAILPKYYRKSSKARCQAKVKMPCLAGGGDPGWTKRLIVHARILPGRWRERSRKAGWGFGGGLEEAAPAERALRIKKSGPESGPAGSGRKLRQFAH